MKTAATERRLLLLLGAALVDPEIRRQLGTLYRLGLGWENRELLAAINTDSKAEVIRQLGVGVRAGMRAVDGLLEHVRKELEDQLAADVAAGVFGAAAELPPADLAAFLRRKADEIDGKPAAAKPERRRAAGGGMGGILGQG